MRTYDKTLKEGLKKRNIKRFESNDLRSRLFVVGEKFFVYESLPDKNIGTIKSQQNASKMIDRIYEKRNTF